MKITLAEKKKFFKRIWERFKSFDSARFERCEIRYIKERDNMMFIRSSSLKDSFLVLNFSDNKQLKKIMDALKNDKSVSIQRNK